jgi:hypothetical protein
MRTSLLLFFAAFNLASCYKNHFYVQQERIDRNFLASSYVHTPDPLQENPPSGQRLVVSWEFPRSTFQKELQICLTIRFWDSTQEICAICPERRRDYSVFFFPDSKKILTYKVEAFTEEGEKVGEWVHQLWAQLITVGQSDS